MSHPRVSVCIPTFNRKEYLRETLESVVSQSYQDFEIVVVDDGSTDGTEEMLRDLEIPIRYAWQHNAGDAAARNRLIEHARGDYIAFIDSDDLLLPGALEQMVETGTHQNHDVIVYGTYLAINERGEVTRRSKRKLHSGYVTTFLFQDIFIHSCGTLLPARIVKGKAAFDTTLRVCSDYDLWLRLSLQYPFVALSDPTFKRRRHSKNLSSPSFANQVVELEVLQTFYYEKGGRNVIPRSVAMKRLSREEHRVGRCAFKEGNYQEAADYFFRAFRRRPTVKSLLFWIVSLAGR
ncbi:MAG: glycosyltransferase [Deltaproteobacteria bacterium]|nr:glycosyltransferase [Deltaproteobacteria bacterium]